MSEHTNPYPQDEVSPRDIQFAIDSPEYVLPSQFPVLSQLIHRPVEVEGIARMYQRDAGPLGFLDDDAVKNLQAAGHLISRINEGRFPYRPWYASEALKDFGIHEVYSQKVLADTEGNDFNMRGTDPEGSPNRLVFYEMLGLQPDQVLSPILGATRDVVTIGSGDKLVFDKAAKRLLPDANEGHADGWLVTEPELANRLAGVGFVADCPMVSLVFTEPGEKGYSKILATGMMHMGWKNVGAGIDLAMAKQIKESGLDTAEIHASVSPGARFGLKLPKELIARKSAGRADFGEALRTDMLRYGVKDTSGEIVEYDGVLAAAQLLRANLGIPAENIYVSDRCTITDPNSHSYRREKDMRSDRPQAGRFASLSMPAFVSNDQSFRGELFGDEARQEQGAVSKVSEDTNKIVYTVN